MVWLADALARLFDNVSSITEIAAGVATVIVGLVVIFDVPDEPSRVRVVNVYVPVDAGAVTLLADDPAPYVMVM